MIRAFSFISGGERYAADVNLVKKVANRLAVATVPSAPEEVIGITNMQGKVVTILSIPVLLNKKHVKASTVGMRVLKAVVFEAKGISEDPMGFEIDSPGDLIEFGADKVSGAGSPKQAEEFSYIYGVFEINGEIYRLIDIEAIIKKYKDSGTVSSEDGDIMGGRPGE